MICHITKTPCDNHKAKADNCIGCYHQFQQDVHNYYNGTGPLPKEMEMMRNANREI